MKIFLLFVLMALPVLASADDVLCREVGKKLTDLSFKYKDPYWDKDYVAKEADFKLAVVGCSVTVPQHGNNYSRVNIQYLDPFKIKRSVSAEAVVDKGSLFGKDKVFIKPLVWSERKEKVAFGLKWGQQLEEILPESRSIPECVKYDTYMSCTYNNYGLYGKNSTASELEYVPQPNDIFDTYTLSFAKGDGLYYMTASSGTSSNSKNETLAIYKKLKKHLSQSNKFVGETVDSNEYNLKTYDSKFKRSDGTSIRLEYSQLLNGVTIEYAHKRYKQIAQKIKLGTKKSKADADKIKDLKLGRTLQSL